MGDRVEAGRVIGRRDVSIAAEKLKGDHERERRLLQDQLEAIASQLEQAREELAAASGSAERAAQRISTLEQRQRGVQRRLEVRSERLAEGLALMERQARIFAGFSGEIVKIDRKPGNETVVYSVLYRGEPGGEWTEADHEEGLELSFLGDGEEDEDEDYEEADY